MIYKIIKHSKVFKKKLQINESDVSSTLRPDLREAQTSSEDAPTPFTERPDGDGFTENLEIKPALPRGGRTKEPGLEIRIS